MILRLLSLSAAWILWCWLIVADAYYVMAALQTKRPASGPSEGGWIFPMALLGVSLLIVGWSVLLRWIYERLLVGRRLPADSPASYVLLPVVGLLIWAPSGAVAIYGLVVYFSLGSFPWFFTFIGISCALLFVHMPVFLEPRRGGPAKTVRGSDQPNSTRTAIDLPR